MKVLQILILVALLVGLIYMAAGAGKSRAEGEVPSTEIDSTAVDTLAVDTTLADSL